MCRDMANIVFAVTIASSNRSAATSSRNRVWRAAAKLRIFCTSGSSRPMPSVLAFSRSCQSGLSIRAARSACRKVARPKISCPVAGSTSSMHLRKFGIGLPGVISRSSGSSM